MEKNIKKIIKKIIKADWQEISKEFKNRKYKLCHLDVNTYKSTKKSFEFVKDRLIKGGVVVFDDYGIYTTDSIKRYVKQIEAKNKRDFTFIYNYMDNVFNKKVIFLVLNLLINLIFCNKNNPYH